MSTTQLTLTNARRFHRPIASLVAVLGSWLAGMVILLLAKGPCGAHQYQQGTFHPSVCAPAGLGDLTSMDYAIATAAAIVGGVALWLAVGTRKATIVAAVVAGLISSAAVSGFVVAQLNAITPP